MPPGRFFSMPGFSSPPAQPRPIAPFPATGRGRFFFGRGSMRGAIDHLDLTVKDPWASRPFYEAVLGHMGYTRIREDVRGFDFDIPDGKRWAMSIGVVKAVREGLDRKNRPLLARASSRRLRGARPRRRGCPASRSACHRRHDPRPTRRVSAIRRGILRAVLRGSRWAEARIRAPALTGNERQPPITRQVIVAISMRLANFGARRPGTR